MTISKVQELLVAFKRAVHDAPVHARLLYDTSFIHLFKFDTENGGNWVFVTSVHMADVDVRIEQYNNGVKEPLVYKTEVLSEGGKTMSCQIYHTPLVSHHAGCEKRTGTLRISDSLNILFPIDFRLILKELRTGRYTSDVDVNTWLQQLCAKYEIQLVIVYRNIGFLAVDAFVSPAIVTTRAFFDAVRAHKAFPIQDVKKDIKASSASPLPYSNWPHNYMFCSNEHVVNCVKDPTFFWKHIFEPVREAMTEKKKYTAELCVNWIGSDVMHSVKADSLEEAKELFEAEAWRLQEATIIDADDLDYQVNDIHEEA